MKKKSKGTLLSNLTGRRKARVPFLVTLLGIPLKKKLRKYRFRSRSKAFRKQPMAGAGLSKTRSLRRK